ncbi:MAG: hypothetical protein LC747_03140 [Acidobacteria bacterium]|nr:hypothetical protein [Acidobacteriota bacterium]
MGFILEQQAQFTTNIQILQEERARDGERLARVERAFVQLTELAVSANERMNEHDARLASVEKAIVMLTRLVSGQKDGK